LYGNFCYQKVGLPSLRIVFHRIQWLNSNLTHPLQWPILNDEEHLTTEWLPSVVVYPTDYFNYYLQHFLAFEIVICDYVLIFFNCYNMTYFVSHIQAFLLVNKIAIIHEKKKSRQFQMRLNSKKRAKIFHKISRKCYTLFVNNSTQLFTVISFWVTTKNWYLTIIHFLFFFLNILNSRSL